MAVMTTQELFSAAMLAYMAELKGGMLKKFCETKTATGGESITFNRIDEAVAKSGVPSMYGNAAVSDAGDMKAIKVVIDEISAQDRVKQSEMNKTTVDIKNAYVRSLGNAIARKEDLTILEKVDAVATEITITDFEADAKKIIEQIRKALAYSTNTPDNYSGTALVISPENWAKLSTSEYVLNADYSAVFGGGTNGEPRTFFGAEVCIIKSAETLTHAYLIPSNAVCFAEWEGSMRGDAIFVPTDGLRWHLQAYKSVGAEVAEATFLVKLGTAGPVVKTLKK